MQRSTPLETAARSPSARWGLVTADGTGLPEELLGDAARLIEQLERVLVSAAKDTSWRHHRFEPGGLSLVGTSSEARVVLHTWPEHRALTMDLYAASAHVERLLADCVRGLTAPP